MTNQTTQMGISLLISAFPCLQIWCLYKKILQWTVPVHQSSAFIGAWDSSFPSAILVVFHEVPVDAFLQPAWVPLDGSPALQHTYCSSQFEVICKLDKSALSYHLQITDKDIKPDRSQCRPLWYPLVTGIHVEYYPLATTLWPYPSN